MMVWAFLSTPFFPVPLPLYVVIGLEDSAVSGQSTRLYGDHLHAEAVELLGLGFHHDESTKLRVDSAIICDCGETEGVHIG